MKYMPMSKVFVDSNIWIYGNLRIINPFATS